MQFILRLDAATQWNSQLHSRCKRWPIFCFYLVPRLTRCGSQTIQSETPAKVQLGQPLVARVLEPNVLLSNPFELRQVIRIQFERDNSTLIKAHWFLRNGRFLKSLD